MPSANGGSEYEAGEGTHPSPVDSESPPMPWLLFWKTFTAGCLFQTGDPIPKCWLAYAISFQHLLELPK